jgi:hypothetical protein
MSSYTIQPKQTHFDGILFETQLEASWAVFFKSLGIEYEYHNDRYGISNFRIYSPDFYLPEQKLFIEIKPDWPMFRDRRRVLRDFARIKGSRLLVCIGSPAVRDYSLRIINARGVEWTITGRFGRIRNSQELALVRSDSYGVRLALSDDVAKLELATREPPDMIEAFAEVRKQLEKWRSQR